MKTYNPANETASENNTVLGDSTPPSSYGISHEDNWVADANKRPMVVRKNGVLKRGTQEQLNRYV